MAPVMVRLEVEAMKYRVVHAFAQHSAEIEEEVESAIEAAMKDFDFVAIVREEAQKALTNAVKEAVAQAASSIMGEKPVRDIITAGAADLVYKAVKKSLDKATF
jgi:nitrogen regulatory protein PII-like uncharacterized protein